MRKRSLWFLLSLLCLGGVMYWWHLNGQGNARRAAHSSAENAANRVATNAHSNVPLIAKKGGATSSVTNSSSSSSPAAANAKNRFPYRLSNTGETPGQLVHNDHAIILANALIDTTKPLNLQIPDRLRAPADNDSYVVQSKGALNNQFRALLRDANASIVSYIPNNAYLVRVSAAGAQQIAADAQTQSVLAYEPYYKLDGSLLKMAVETPSEVPSNGRLRVTLFPDTADQTILAMQQLGAEVLGQDRSPFGPVMTVQPAPGSLSTIASLSGVEGVAAFHSRVHANDMDRVRLNVSADSLQTTPNYLGLTGTNVVVDINDGGVDASHPDLTNRIFTITPSTNSSFQTLIASNALKDWSGHGTHVAGTILGSGLESPTVTTTPPGSAKNPDFRGMAPNATGFVLPIFAGTDFFSSPISVSDSYLQEQAALTNALISNNSWNYGGDYDYDILAASYDAAVRDALPETNGSQPVLFVFSAGNEGGGYDDGTGGSSDSILSPATAKNVITVGAIEQPRFLPTVITNQATNQFVYDSTDNAQQVASFSSRGNVGINVEGTYGRFKPDLVTPGTAVISCRSGQWVTNYYYNPTNYSFYYYTSNSIATNATNSYLFPVPITAVGMIITLQTNGLTGSTNLPPLSIYVKENDFPTDSGTPFGTNQVIFPNTNGGVAIPLSGGDTIYFDVVNNLWSNTVNYNVQIEVLTTNDNASYYGMLSNLNNTVAPYYRYEWGTSMSAAGVSGMLALMQEFFEQRMHVTNSPALMKALLINGSRSLSDQYDFAVSNPNQPTFQGWGLPSLPNVIPPAISNVTAGGLNGMPLQFFDQNPSNALATGQSWTRTVTLSGAATNQDLRITLVWTDPPGSPQAGVKLVNDLDLIVSNMDTGEVFYGNDIPPGSAYNQPTVSSNAPNIDSINNVENVFLSAPGDGPFVVTVLGRRVNVNAVTANTTNIVQDYALVISAGDAGATSGVMTIADNGLVTNNVVSNFFVLSNNVPLLNQRVGANSQFAGSTNGTPSQWNFYVFTNTAAMTNGNYTNVAFVTFMPPNLSVPRMGAFNEVAPPDPTATRYAGADVDLYVSSDPGLTNLLTNVVNGASKSVGRIGNEVVFFTNSTAGQVYYIGVKSEDQNAAQYDLIGFATDVPFSQQNTNGNTTVNMNPVPLTIPGGTPTSPQSAMLIGICTSPMQVRKVVVSNTVTCQDFGDYIGSLSEGNQSAVLNNHSFFTNPNDVTETLIYDDSGENEIPNSITSAGPGTLKNFVGVNAMGSAWTYTIVNDSSPTDSGSISNMTLTLERQPPPNAGRYTLPPLGAESWYYGFVDVPANATNLTISVIGNNGPFDLYIQDGNFPTANSFEKMTNITSLQGGALSINKFDTPPLNAGRYFFAIYTESTAEPNLSLGIELDYSLAPGSGVTFYSPTNQLIQDDAVTYSVNHVTANSAIAGAEVGVRIMHSRESDLVLTLVSPQGTRVLLSENRGGLDTNGYGSGTNYVLGFAATSGGAATFSTNVFVGANSGVLDLSYNFYTLPDQMAVFYDGAKIYDTGMISGSGNLVVPFGPGNSQYVTITMNPYGNSNGTNGGDAWDFSATITAQNMSYVVFTEDTNMTTTPIKFATPPFGAASQFIPATTVVSNSFEDALPGTYGLNTNIPSADGFNWTVTATNGSVSQAVPTVVQVPQLAYDGTNVLALHGGTITRTLPTVAGRKYTLTFANHGRPSQPQVSWWKGEGNTLDSIDGNSLYDVSTNDFVTYTNGVVGNAFWMDGNVQLRAPDAPNLQLTNALTVEGWVNPQGITNQAVILQRGSDGPNPYSLSVQPSVTNVGGLDLTWQITGTNASASITAPLSQNVFSHVAGAFVSSGTNGLLVLYVNGIAVASEMVTNLQPVGFIPVTLEPGLGLGTVGMPVNASGFVGALDEFAIYTNGLSTTNVQDIYAAGSAGKQFVNQTESVTAEVIFAGTTNLFSARDAWDTQVYSFTAPSNNMTLTFVPNRDGMLIDSVHLVQDSMPNPANYYLPEESLAKLEGENSFGDWQLEVMDNRVGATNPPPVLVSWYLNLQLSDQIALPIPLVNGVTQSNIVAPGAIVYYEVSVPSWASAATNMVFNASGPVTLLFNQNTLPTGANFGDYTLFANQTSGTSTLQTGGTTPVLQPGQTYYLGVTNAGPAPVTFGIEVMFNITPLTNHVASAGLLGTEPRYYSFTVSSNSPVMAEFQILRATANLELIASYGLPLPDTNSFDYLSDVPGASPQQIIVLTNSSPVVLAPGTWYLGVINNSGTIGVRYSIEATEIDQSGIHVIELTNNVPVTNTVTANSLVTNFYHFNISDTNIDAALFELYNLSGNVDLTLQKNAYPFGPPYFAGSFNPGTNREQIVLRTNQVGTNLFGDWYLGVPNNTSGTVTFTIRASTATNGLLLSGLPLKVTATAPPPGGFTLSWPGVLGDEYEIDYTTNLPPNWQYLATIIADGSTVTFTDTNTMTGTRYYRIKPLPNP